MAYVLSLSRCIAWVLLLLMHLSACGLYLVPLARHTGGAYEIGCLVMHIFATVLLVVEALLDRSRAEVDNTPDIVLTSVQAAACLATSMLITARVAQHPGLAGDYGAQTGHSSLAIAVVIFEWLTVIVAVAAVVFARCDRLPGVSTPARNVRASVLLRTESDSEMKRKPQIAPLGHIEKYQISGPRWPEPTYTSLPRRDRRMARVPEVNFDSNRMVASTY